MRAVQGPQPRFFVQALRAPLNQTVLDQLRTADRHGLALSVIRDGRRPGARWRPTDRTLAVALTAHQDGLCTGCGQPVDEAWTGAHEYHTEHKTCAACAALDKHRDSEAKPAPGVKTYPVRAESQFGATRFGPNFD